MAIPQRPLKITSDTDNSLRWAAIPLLIIAFMQGLPIGRELGVAEEQFAEKIYETTYTAATTAGYANTMLLVVLLGLCYLYTFKLLIFNRPREAVYVMGNQKPLIFLALFILAGVVWSFYPEKVITNFVHFVGTLAIALVAALRYRDEPQLLIQQLSLVLGLNILIHLSAVFFIPSMAMDYDGRWRGLTTNANNLGMISFVALWASGASLLSVVGNKRKLYLFCLLLAVVALLGSRSVTSMISGAVAFGGVYFLNDNIAKSTKCKSLPYLPWIGVVSLILAILAVSHIIWPWNIDDVTSLAGRSSNLSGRSDIWSEGLDLIRIRPLLGWGFDDNASVVSQAGLIHTTWHNGYVDLAVKGGGLALVLFVSSIVLGFRSVFTEPKHKILFVPIIASLLIYNISEASFVAPRHILWLVYLFCVFIMAATEHNKRITKSPVNKIL